ncbi:MAG: glycosyl hydrolase family 17 [Candidatus Marinimicrobia bacterium]|nr:glycosyl hydrolase family 17 [Candidatus Neomarinimicrobiota bacterium]
MKSTHLLVASIFLMSSLLFNCQTQVPATPVVEKTIVLSEAELIQKIGSVETVFTRQAGFQKRPFSPYLGDKWIGNAISYGCYREGQAPGVKGPTEEEILEDLTILSKHWNLIRVYGSDDDSERVLKVIHDNQLPIRVMLGIWLENETKRPERKPLNLEQIARGIVLANRFPDEIIAVNVGNETQVDWSWHHMEMQNLIRYIRAVRQYTTLPITTADDYNFWNKPESKLVADEIDFICLHAYPLWNGKTLEEAISWIDTVYKSALAFHPDMLIALSETGWATVYDPNKQGPGEEGALVKAEVSIDAQEYFLKGFNTWINDNQVTSFLFEAFDEPWKGGGAQSGPDVMEKHWGVFYEDRTPKESFTNYLNKQTHKDMEK